MQSRYVLSWTTNNKLAFKYSSIDHIQLKNYANHIGLISDNHENNYDMSSSHYIRGLYWLALLLEWMNKTVIYRLKNILNWAKIIYLPSNVILLIILNGILIYILFGIGTKTNISLQNIKENLYNISNTNKLTETINILNSMHNHCGDLFLQETRNNFIDSYLSVLKTYMLKMVKFKLIVVV